MLFQTANVRYVGDFYGMIGRRLNKRGFFDEKTEFLFKYMASIRDVLF